MTGRLQSPQVTLLREANEMKGRFAALDQQITEVVARHGFDGCGVVAVKDFVFEKSLHDMCATNQCGNFDTNWSCPPGVGSYQELLERIRSFDRGLVVQSVWDIDDSFDIEGMMRSQEQHNAMMRSLIEDLYPLLKNGKKLTLSAGACSLCKTCSYVENKPCRMPERAFGAVEAHGIDVAALLERCDLKYNNGPNTVSYVGMVLTAETTP